MSLRTWLIGLAALGAITTYQGTAAAVTINGSGLQNGINSVLDPDNINVNTDQLGGDEIWQIDGQDAVTTILFEFAGFAGANIFGIYDPLDPSKKVQLFAGADSAGKRVQLEFVGALNQVRLTTLSPFSIINTGIFFAQQQFGFYLSTPQNQTFFSQTALNSDGLDHFVAFQGKGTSAVTLPGGGTEFFGSNDAILGFEDLLGGGDQDYDDFAVYAQDVTPVPEPTTLGLLGMGLLGLGAMLRRRPA